MFIPIEYKCVVVSKYILFKNITFVSIYYYICFFKYQRKIDYALKIFIIG